jgi:hypothetical protein
MADGLLKVPEAPETGLSGSILYPLRSAEAMGMIVILGLAFWGVTILVPEYCLGIHEDANMLGAPLMGTLVMLISALPALLLFPLFLIYALQYLGRVLVSSAMGDVVPPRTPDRNWDGLFNGLGPWLLWLTMGASIGLLPLLYYAASVDPKVLASPLRAAVLVMPGLPYLAAALMLSFLHDEPLAATPPRVIASLIRHIISFLKLSIPLCGVIAVNGLLLTVVLAARTSHFWLYLFAILGYWMTTWWSAIAVMRMLGVHYYHQRDALKWHRDRSRWRVSWKP